MEGLVLLVPVEDENVAVGAAEGDGGVSVNGDDGNEAVHVDIFEPGLVVLERHVHGIVVDLVFWV